MCINGYTAKVFAIAGPRLWNNTLDDELRKCRNVELFKNKLKTLLFRSFLLMSVMLSILFNLYVRLLYSIVFSVSLYSLLFTVICFSLHTLD